ncbi:V-type proton ATPase subunit e 2 [Sipha flava]|uniref:V-type proton ATPase subunit n=1 Tax=Sipha flava TaxID=143950 RepID=A0A8B8G6P3_9HEMI|nr:V-type proton ATPase subunit e 2 [Sipha flava]
MGAAFLPVLIFTSLWGVVGIVLPFLLPKGPDRGVQQLMLMMTAATCYLFWLCCYMAQMNPLVGPKLNNHTILIIAREWGNLIEG